MVDYNLIYDKILHTIVALYSYSTWRNDCRELNRRIIPNYPYELRRNIYA